MLIRGLAWCGGTEYLRVWLQEQTRGADTDERMMKEEGIPSGDRSRAWWGRRLLGVWFRAWWSDRLP